MRILFLGKRHYTNKDALKERFGRIYQLPAHWHRQGHAVSLLLVDYHGRHEEREDADGFGVRSLPVRRIGLLRELDRSVRSLAPQVLVSAGDNLIGMLGHRLARRAGAISVFDAYDDFRHYGSSRAFLGWDAFDWLRRHADATFYASKVLAAEHPPGPPSLVVPNAVSPAGFSGLDPTAERERAGLPADAALVGYFGSMEPDRGLTFLVDAVARLRLQSRNVHLLVAGRQDKRTPLPGADVDWFHYPGLVPHASVPGLMAACDVLAMPYLRSPLLDTSSSCKIGEYLFTGRPIAATRTPNLEANFPLQAEALADRLAEPGDAGDLARVIGLQLDAPRIPPAPDHFTWAAVAASASEFLERLLARA